MTPADKATPADLTVTPALRTDSVYIFARYAGVTFEPQPDITAYELAQILAQHWLNGITEEQLETLGPMTRHFRRTA